ncbi:MAG TPA: nuclear transport factor 2 family protein [Acidimicrobiales bacterium]|jgi:ketosteroid isomerase-like protein
MTIETTTERALGDPVPPAADAYYRALDRSRFEEAVAAFADDVVYAAPAFGAGETSPRVETVGRDALLGWFRDRGPRAWAHDLQLCVVDGPTCLLEGVSHDTADGRVLASFAASLRLAPDGAIARYLAYATTPAVALTPADAAGGDADADAAPGDALDVLGRYFDALDGGRFEEAAACFSEDVVYSHPPYRHTGIDGDRRVQFDGRAELLANFEARGRQSFGHRLVADVQRGPHCMVEGLVEGLPGGRDGSFLSSFTLDGDGLIRRYVSFYCEPAVRAGR